MATKVTLMTTSDDPRKVNKTLSELKTISCELKENTDMLDPILKISEKNMANISKCNYLYIPIFKRYYFVTNIKLCVGQYAEIQCHVDVLHSFKDGINDINTFIVRQEKTYNKYIVDEHRPVRVERIIDKKNIGTVGSVSGTNFYLTVNNGG